MSYRSKPLNVSRRKASAERVESQDKLHTAIASIGNASRGIKKLNEDIAKKDKSDAALRYFTYGAKRASDDKAEKRDSYDAWKKQWETVTSSAEYLGKDNFFPDFDDWYKNRTPAKVGGKEMTRYDMTSGEFDIDKINMIIKLMELGDGS